jgi:hypothetical protein
MDIGTSLFLSAGGLIRLCWGSRTCSKVVAQFVEATEITTLFGIGRRTPPWRGLPDGAQNGSAAWRAHPHGERNGSAAWRALPDRERRRSAAW